MTTTEAASFLRHPDYELLQARYVHHRFGLHAHDSFVLAVVEDGAEGLRVGDTRLVAYPGDVVLFGPGEAHDGWARDGRGFSYRAVYPADQSQAATQGGHCERSAVRSNPSRPSGAAVICGRSR